VWELRAYAGRDPLTGRKRYETKTVRAVMTKREAQRAVDAYAVEVHGEPVGAAGVKFGDLLEKWFAIAGPRMVPAGQRETRWIINRRLGALALVPLDRLGGRTGTAILDEFYAALRDHGGLCRRRVEKCASRCEHGGGAPLSDASVVRTHVVVRAALEQDDRWGLIARNPPEHAYAGEPGAVDVAPPAPGDVVRLFQLAEEDPEFVVFLVVASTTGQRRGRMLALKWEDLDLDGGVASFGHVISLGPDGPVRVEAGRGKRNRKGRRVDAPLDPAVTAILIAHRARCVARAALAGVELADDGYVFARDGVGGEPWHPQTVTRWFGRLRSRAGLDETRLHDLRHFVVSYLIASGVDLATVKELVGHSATSSTTLGTYAHSVTERKRQASGILARLLELDDTSPPDADAELPDADVIRLDARRA